MNDAKQGMIRLLLLIFLCSLFLLARESFLTGRIPTLPIKMQGKQILDNTTNKELALDPNRIGMTSLSKGEESGGMLPQTYDNRLTKRTGKIKNQKDLGTCWAFAALSAMEATIRPNESLTFSPDHMTLQNNFSAGQREGGQYTMAMAYLVSWKGPVLEADDPYNDGVSERQLKAVKHVQEIQIVKDKDYDAIKRAVYSYGGVQSSLYTSLTDAASESSYYNKKKAAYCYMGSEKANHDIVIVGWDDQYPKENFTQPVQGDGAFICQNSWGTRFGDKGFFYVSYYDSNIGKTNVVYTKVENSDNYNHIYQSDLCGWVGQLGYGDEHAFFANIYQTEQEEALKAAGFYATDFNTKYKIYVVPGFKGVASLSDREPVASGSLTNPGFYTVEWGQKVNVKSGQKFAVVVEITTPNTTQPVAVEYRADKITQNVDLEDGKGYISYSGSEWTSAEHAQDCNLCLKVYTDDIP